VRGREGAGAPGAGAVWAGGGGAPDLVSGGARGVGACVR
jgi:hypothetical protein